MKPLDSRRIFKRIWLWAFILTVSLWLWPVEYQITKLAFALGILTVWAGALVLFWRRRICRIVLILVGIAPVAAFCLPGRTANSDQLAEDYCQTLRLFEGTRYVWGGENFLGIDCSGLVRKGLIVGQAYHGLCTLNGRPIRSAVELWWNDCSAKALRDGYRDWTGELFQSRSIMTADHSKLKAGDLAVTADGIHILAYLGNQTWIEADPSALKVLKIQLPTDNQWFHVRVVFVRWAWLEPVNPGKSN